MTVAEITRNEETRAVEESQADNLKQKIEGSFKSEKDEFHQPKWQKRSLIQDAFYRYGGYYS